LAQLVFAHRVRRELLELGWPWVDAVENTLARLEREPDIGQPLRGRLRGLCSLRVGSYRVIYQLLDGGQTVRVVAVRHRAVAYRSDPR
jgi:mRNA-degrading endonuclease RelE of RelBE toxin-antitoxin system